MVESPQLRGEGALGHRQQLDCPTEEDLSTLKGRGGSNAGGEGVGEFVVEVPCGGKHIILIVSAAARGWGALGQKTAALLSHKRRLWHTEGGERIPEERA